MLKSRYFLGSLRSSEPINTVIFLACDIKDLSRCIILCCHLLSLAPAVPTCHHPYPYPYLESPLRDTHGALKWLRRAKLTVQSGSWVIQLHLIHVHLRTCSRISQALCVCVCVTSHSFSLLRPVFCHLLCNHEHDRVDLVLWMAGL